METGFIQNLFADRIGGKDYGTGDTTYKFAKIKQAKQEVQVANPDIKLIDLGVGEPDAMAHPDVIKALQEAVTMPQYRGYADNGGMEFREAAARYMQTTFGVNLDPVTEIIHSMGSKAALSILPTCLINPGDFVLMTTPGYGVFGVHAKYYGGNIYDLPLTEENNFLPDLESIPEKILKKSKILVLNYPNNPTGASATKAFFEKAVNWAKKHEIVIVQDAAYSALVFDGEPISILQIPGAKDVAIELHSLSKSFNMTGWRIGWVCGNPLLVKAYGDVKDNTDSGQFLAVQKAAAKALDMPEITREIAKKYSRRMDMLVEVLSEVGFEITKPKAGFFLYCKVPKSFESAESFSQWLIKSKLISTVPWDEAGPYVRFSVTFYSRDEAEERVVIGEVQRRLSSSWGTLESFCSDAFATSNLIRPLSRSLIVHESSGLIVNPNSTSK